MKILFATGGTAGHINPALAVASYIREKYPDSEILFVGTADHMESRLVPNAGFDFKTIKISGFRRSFAPKAIVHNIKTVCQLVTSNSACKKIIKDFKPDVAVGFGGYVSGPVLQTAVSMHIPTCIHEQNAYPGITNKTLAKEVDKVMLTVEDAKKHLEPKNEVVVTGLPVRGELLKARSAVHLVQSRLMMQCLIFFLKAQITINITIFIQSELTAVNFLKNSKKTVLLTAKKAW